MRFAAVFLASLALACSANETQAPDQTPPFEVRGDLEGISLTWFDEEGAHVAVTREDVPEAHRDRVRVDRMDLPPESRDPDAVWIADLREAGEGGAYPVERVDRDALDALMDEGVEIAAAADPADITIYGASWCGACRSAAAYLRSREVPFVERDIEREPEARAEMQTKAREAGLRPSGIPVIDFRGTILTGFDRGRIDQLLAAPI